MSIMSRLQNGWRLFKSSVSIMGTHPKLLAFPALIFFFTLGILSFFVLPVVFQPTQHTLTSKEHWSAVARSVFTQESIDAVKADAAKPEASQADRPELALTPQAMGYLAVIYFASMFLATFFSVAFYHEIMAALVEKPVSILGGLRFALSRWPAILLWSLFAGLIGYAIKTLEERVGLIGKIILRVVGVAWSVASVFAIPVLINEDVKSPIEVLRRSADTLRKTWGEALLGFVGLQFGGLLAMVGSVLLLGTGGFLAIQLKSPVIMGASVALWLIALFLFSYALGVAAHIYRAALFLYASQGVAPGPYTNDDMNLAWKYKK